MPGYVSMDDILKGVTSTPAASNSTSPGYVSMDSILKNDSVSPQSQIDYNNARGASEMDEMRQIGQGRSDLLAQSPPPEEDVATKARNLPIIGSILRGLDAFSNSPVVSSFDYGAGKAMGVPDNMMNSPKSTGSGLLDSAINFAGQGAGYLTNPAQIEQNVGNVFFGNSAVQNAGSRIGSLVESKLPQNVLGRAATNVAEQGTVGALGSAAYAPFQTLIGGQDVQNIPRNVVEQGLMGGLLGGALGGAGSLAKSGYKSMEEILNGSKEAPLPDYSNVALSQGRGIGVAPPRTQLTTEPIAEPNQAPRPLPPLTDNYLKPLSHYTDTMYRETSPENALDLIPGVNRYSDMKGDQLYLANSKDSALGQGLNKGIMIEFDSKGLQGQVNRSKPSWEMSYNNGDAEFIAKNNSQSAYQDAIKSVTIQPNAKMDRSTQVRLNRALSNWDKVNNPDGSVSYLPPKEKVLNSDTKQPELIKLTPQEQAKQARTEQFSKVEENPVIPDTSTQIQSKTVAERTPLAQVANEAYIKGVDNLHRMNQFDQTVAKVTGELKPSESSYTLGLNSRGSDMISRQILEKNLVDSQGNVIGNSLKAVADTIPKGKQKAFEDYLIAKHAVTRMGRGEKVYKDSMNMTAQKAQMRADQLEQANPGFKEAAAAYYDYNRKLGHAWLVDTGLISQKQWDGYLQANPHYVPNQRIFSKLEQTQQFGSKGGFANQTAPVKKAEGSQRPIVSPMESTIENTAKYVKTSKQNEVMQTLYHNIQKDPEAFKAWAEIANEPKSDITQILHEEGPEGLLDEVAKSFESAKQKPDLTKGNIVSTFINGERVHLRINDPQLLEALTNLSPQAQPKWIEAIGKVTKVMKTLTTGLNPVFSLTRNIARDLPHAYVSSKTITNALNPLETVKFGKDILGAFVDVLGHREAYNSYKNIGGGHSSSVASDRNLLAQSKERILPSTGIGQTLKRTLVTKPFHALENFNNAIETAPRLAEFKRLNKGTYDSKVNALYQANDLTTNFNKYGTYTKQLDSLVPYLNASVQGLDQLARMFKTNPVGATTKAVAAITLPTAILYAVNHDDPNYQQVSNFIKDNNFLIPKGDGTFWKVPKSRELGMVFSSGIERAMRAWHDSDPAAFKDFAANLLQNFMPPNPVTSNILSPVVTNLPSNKDFAGRPIVPGDLAKLSPQNQYDSKTSEPAKLIGQLTNTSPKQLDYLAKSYGGIVGQLGIPLTTKGGSIGDTLKQQVTADPAYSNDISKNFYDAKTKADTAKADQKATGNPTDDAAYQKYYDRISTHIAKIRKYMKGIQSDDSLSKAEKNAQLRDLQQQLNEYEQQSTLK